MHVNACMHASLDMCGCGDGTILTRISPFSSMMSQTVLLKTTFAPLNDLGFSVKWLSSSLSINIAENLRISLAPLIPSKVK